VADVIKDVYKELGALSDTEQAAWRKLWADSEQLLNQART